MRPHSKPIPHRSTTGKNREKPFIATSIKTIYTWIKQWRTRTKSPRPYSAVQKAAVTHRKPKSFPIFTKKICTFISSHNSIRIRIRIRFAYQNHNFQFELNKDKQATMGKSIFFAGISLVLLTVASYASNVDVDVLPTPQNSNSIHSIIQSQKRHVLFNSRRLEGECRK